MTDRELMQQALDALDQLAEARSFLVALQVRAALLERLAQPEHDWEAEYSKQVELHNQTLDELRDALAQPEHEWLRGECIKCGQSMEQQDSAERIAELKDVAKEALDAIHYWHWHGETPDSTKLLNNAHDNLRDVLFPVGNDQMYRPEEV